MTLNQTNTLIFRCYKFLKKSFPSVKRFIILISMLNLYIDLVTSHLHFYFAHIFWLQNAIFNHTCTSLIYYFVFIHFSHGEISFIIFLKFHFIKFHSVKVSLHLKGPAILDKTVETLGHISNSLGTTVQLFQDCSSPILWLTPTYSCSQSTINKSIKNGQRICNFSICN